MNEPMTAHEKKKAEREARLAAQLRANLRRRKAVVRKHKDKDGEN